MCDLQGNYVEWFGEIERLGGEFAWIRQEKLFFEPQIQQNTVAKVCDAVLESQKVVRVIGLETLRRNCLRVEVEKEAHTIINEMAHNFQLGAVKPIGYAVLKVVKVYYILYFLKLKKIKFNF